MLSYTTEFQGQDLGMEINSMSNIGSQKSSKKIIWIVGVQGAKRPLRQESPKSLLR